MSHAFKRGRYPAPLELAEQLNGIWIRASFDGEQGQWLEHRDDDAPAVE